MRVPQQLRTALRSAVAAIGAIGIASSAMSPDAYAQPASPDTVFGIRLGQPLESQFGECPKNDKGEYGFGYHKGAMPCWKQDKYGKDVSLPAQVLKDTNAFVDSTARIKVRDGLVVEIEVHAHRDTWRQAERYMLRNYGKPLETETYERASRVSGESKHRAHTWRAHGVSLYFTERASNDNARIRAVNDAWAKIDAKEREELNKLLNRGGGD